MPSSFVDYSCLRSYHNTLVFALQPGSSLLQKGFPLVINDLGLAGACAGAARLRVVLVQEVLVQRAQTANTRAPAEIVEIHLEMSIALLKFLDCNDTRAFDKSYESDGQILLRPSLCQRDNQCTQESCDSDEDSKPNL